MSNEQTSESLESASRRELLLGATAMTAALATGNSFAATDHDHHHHHGMMSNPNTAVIDAALDCIKKGDACNDHCIELVKMGDTSIADCLDSVAVMLPLCGALSKVASANSHHLAALAKVCIAACKDCHDQCEKHKDTHVECKACMESCAACIKECEKVAA